MDLIHTFIEEWRRLPRPVWRRWLLFLTGGWMVTGLLMAGLVFLTRDFLVAGILAQEGEWLTTIVERMPINLDSAVWMNLPGYAHFSIPVVFVAAIISIRRGRALHALSFLAAYFMIALVVMLGWAIWTRPRPDLVLDGMLAPGFNSFPSGHVAQATATYGFLFYVWFKASYNTIERLLAVILAMILIGTISLGRLLMGAHWISDTIAGAIIGIVWLSTLIGALHFAQRVQGKSVRHDTELDSQGRTY